MNPELDLALLGYATPWSLPAGDTLSVHVSAFNGGAYDASLVRLWSGDSRPKGTGFRADAVAASFTGSYPGQPQSLHPGSYALLPGLPALTDFVCALSLYPTMPHKDAVVLHAPGFVLCTRAGALVLQLGGTAQHELRCERLLRAERWHDIRIQVAQDTATLTVDFHPLGASSAERAQQERVVFEGARSAGCPAGDWTLAAHVQAGIPAAPCFNGRLEGVRVYQGAAQGIDPFAPVAETTGLVAAWDFGREIHSSRVIDSGPAALHGRLYQTPTRGVRGRHWNGTAQCCYGEPTHYAAVHFHEDDLTDAGWQADFEWQVPADLPSGVYAIRLAQGDALDYVPFFVTAKPGKATAPVALLASTATYLAYANQRLGLTGGDMFATKAPRNPYDRYLLAHPEVGLSLYEHHADGSGVHFSSARRPVLNFKPNTVPWSFNADTNLGAWLGAIDQPFDVISDQDLHAHGAAALQGYAAVITGTHPEYYSTAMLDGLQDYLGNGGRLMYMGGNGFYWRVAFNPEDDQMLEVRRAEDGTRAWIAEPGSYFHQWSQEYGGMWRRQGRAPNQLVGIGFAAQGFDGGTYYRFKPAAADPRVAFMFAGVSTADKFGAYGTQGGGAAGEEIDRFDLSLGSPAHALVIASSEQHRPGMLRVKEEFLMTRPLEDDAKVRADMTFFETVSGGAVFATGSISYAGALSHNDYDNDVARLTQNVLQRFLDPEPFSYPE